MKTNQGILIHHTADDSQLRLVLHDWGYSEKEIQRLLSDTRYTGTGLREKREVNIEHDVRIKSGEYRLTS